VVRRRREAPEAPPNEARNGGGWYKLAHPHGFVDENGSHHFWHAGQRVRDARELELLRARGVDLTEE